MPGNNKTTIEEQDIIFDSKYTYSLSSSSKNQNAYLDLDLENMIKILNKCLNLSQIEKFNWREVDIQDETYKTFMAAYLKNKKK